MFDCQNVVYLRDIMALINLKNGKTIDVDLFWYLSLTDEELQDLESMNLGFEIENPFHGSAIHKRGHPDDDDEPKEVGKNPKIDVTERDDI